ncbi:unnamed protein product [Candida verbasci]|uniref:Uncharacterized protein n=1 Tax=Candida verbasci TaxID=1227364 RepID=A0A9W4TSG5_9ASCO|nr:unnamed protein product [Candida verbasci]
MSYTPHNQPIRAPPVHSDYELIDGDPYFFKVLRYFRSSDYLNWGILTATPPILMKLWEHYEPHQGKGRKPIPMSGMTLRAATSIGFFGGFFLAYIKTARRFLGWEENSTEVSKDRFEMKKLLSEGIPPYFEHLSSLDDRTKDVSNRNSQYSVAMLFLLPWFNLSYHPYHQVDLKKYYEVRPGEEDWKFDLKPLDEIYGKYNLRKPTVN